jgi:hypothetical protein
MYSNLVECMTLKENFTRTNLSEPCSANGLPVWLDLTPAVQVLHEVIYTLSLDNQLIS